MCAVELTDWSQGKRKAWDELGMLGEDLSQFVAVVDERIERTGALIEELNLGLTVWVERRFATETWWDEEVNYYAWFDLHLGVFEDRLVVERRNSSSRIEKVKGSQCLEEGYEIVEIMLDGRIMGDDEMRTELQICRRRVRLAAAPHLGRLTELYREVARENVRGLKEWLEERAES